MRTIVRGAVVAAATTLAMGMAGSAFAAPSGLEANPNAKPNSNANCVAAASAIWQHNGQAGTLGQGGDPSHGTRGDEIKAFQASC